MTYAADFYLAMSGALTVLLWVPYFLRAKAAWLD